METQIKLVEFQGQISKCVVIKDLKINRRTRCERSFSAYQLLGILYNSMHRAITRSCLP